MISIPITPEAYRAIKRVLPKTNDAASLGGDGLIRIWLDQGTLNGSVASAGPARVLAREL